MGPIGQSRTLRYASLTFSLLLLPALVSAERCATSTLVLHCTGRCAGVNASSVSSSNPAPEQVLAPPSADVLAQLENEADGASGRYQPRSRSFGLFAQLGEGKPQPHAGSPTATTVPSALNFSDQTVYAPAHRAFTPEQLMALLGPASGVEWAPLAKSHLGCVDGRHATPGLYAYGGDLGEFALGLSVLEHVAQRQVGQAETTRLLEGWLRTLGESGGGFGACVDAAAASQLAAAVGLGSQPLELSNPPEEVRADVMVRLVAPEFVGSDHLKWMLHYPQTYATRTALVEQVIRAFFGILWNPYHPSKHTLALDTLSGARAERAVVHVHASHWCATEQRLAPTLPTKTRGGSMFIYHPDAVAARREALARQLAGSVTPPVASGELLARVKTLGDGQAALSEKALAGMLRSYALMVR